MDSAYLSPAQLLAKYAGWLTSKNSEEARSNETLVARLRDIGLHKLANLNAGDAYFISHGEPVSIHLDHKARGLIADIFCRLPVTDRAPLFAQIDEALAFCGWTVSLQSQDVDIPLDFRVGGHSGPGFLVQSAHGLCIYVSNRLSYGPFSVSREDVERKHLAWPVLRLHPRS